MSKIDVNEVKKKILEILEKDGPSLPLPIAKKINMQPMFASAILSELLNEKRIKISSMKIGSSPLYFFPGHEAKLELFIDNLTGVEKEAYLKLRDNKILDDEKQEAKLRVALRGLKDFAIPIQNGQKIFWKYLTLSNEKAKEAIAEGSEIAVGERTVGQKIWEDIKKEQKIEERLSPQTLEKTEKIVNVLVQEAKETVKQLPVEEQIEFKKELPLEKPKKIRKLTEKEIFLEQVKRILVSKNIELLEVISFDKTQVIGKARVKVDKNCILFFLDKKRPEEKDLQKAYKKSQEYNLPYYIMTQAEPAKKLKENAEMFKHMLGLDSVE